MVPRHYGHPKLAGLSADCPQGNLLVSQRLLQGSLQELLQANHQLSQQGGLLANQPHNQRSLLDNQQENQQVNHLASRQRNHLGSQLVNRQHLRDSLLHSHLGSHLDSRQ